MKVAMISAPSSPVVLTVIVVIEPKGAYDRHSEESTAAARLETSHPASRAAPYEIVVGSIPRGGRKVKSAPCPDFLSREGRRGVPDNRSGHPPGQGGRKNLTSCFLIGKLVRGRKVPNRFDICNQSVAFPWVRQ